MGDRQASGQGQVEGDWRAAGNGRSAKLPQNIATLDKRWTKLRHLSSICPEFVQAMNTMAHRFIWRGAGGQNCLTKGGQRLDICESRHSPTFVQVQGF